MSEMTKFSKREAESILDAAGDCSQCVLYDDDERCVSREDNSNCRENIHAAARTLYGNELQRSDRDEMAWQFYKDACITAYSRGVLINKSGEQLPGMTDMSYSVVDAFLSYRDRQNG